MRVAAVNVQHYVRPICDIEVLILARKSKAK